MFPSNDQAVTKLACLIQRFSDSTTIIIETATVYLERERLGGGDLKCTYSGGYVCVAVFVCVHVELIKCVQITLTNTSLVNKYFGFWCTSSHLTAFNV